MAAWLPVCLSLSRLRSNVLYSNTLIFSRLIPSFDTSTGRICWLGKWSLPSNLSWWVSEERTTGKITVGSKDRVEPTERAWGIELRSSHVTVLCVDTSLTLPLPPHLCLPSRLSSQQSAEDVSQFDSKFTSQTPVDSPDDSTLSESANQAFLVTSQATIPHLLFVLLSLETIWNMEPCLVC